MYVPSFFYIKAFLLTHIYLYSTLHALPICSADCLATFGHRAQNFHTTRFPIFCEFAGALEDPFVLMLFVLVVMMSPATDLLMLFSSGKF